MTLSYSSLTVGATVWPLALLTTLFLLSDGRPPDADGPTSDPRHSSPVAEDQIFNEGGSAPAVSSSLVEDGLSSGTVDSGGNLDGDAGFSDPIGQDAFRGTMDDDLSPTSNAATVDAGDNGQLPLDRFDLDGDGDTSEHVPIDIRGRERIVVRGSGSATVDLGAYEYDEMNVARDRQPDAPDASFRLDAPYPNPSASEATVEFLPGAASRARLIVYDVLGRQIMTPFDGPVRPGTLTRTHLDLTSLPSGHYMVRLTAGSNESETRLTVAR